MASQGLSSTDPKTPFQRDSVCLARPAPGSILHKGDEGFDAYHDQLYDSAESRALSHLTHLKSRLRSTAPDDFWRVALAGLAKLTDTQMVWITRRMKVADDGSNAELPTIGEPGSFFHCVAWYYTDGHDNDGFGRDLKTRSVTSPSAYMRFNKVLLLPEGLARFAPSYEYMGQMPFKYESYLGIPLFADGECIGHFGGMHTEEGLANRRLGWGFLEMLFHAFEDICAERLLDETEPLVADFDHLADADARQATSVQTFKPYAQSLSHELRTPMQGIVGMLDVMQASLNEAAETAGTKAEEILRRLQEDIESTQDSCRRAVEAADNVVQAYDLNMGLPITPPDSEEGERRRSGDAATSYHATQQDSAKPRVRKRSKDYDTPRALHPRKIQPLECDLASYSDRQLGLQDAVRDAEDLTAAYRSVSSKGRQEAHEAWQRQQKSRSCSPSRETGYQHLHLADLLKWVINESLKIGGRPRSMPARDIPDGQIITATFRTNDGKLKAKSIEWRVEQSVPEVIAMHERNLAKIVSCVFQNALKFTDEGNISVIARVLPNTHHVNIVVRDSGPGITRDFRSHIFEPFTREEYTTTRGSEGLGLGLLVAKALAHKLGGDLQLVRSEQDGPMKGSDFEIDLPLSPVSLSRPPSRGPDSRRSSLVSKFHTSPTISSRKRLGSVMEGGHPPTKLPKLELPSSDVNASAASSATVSWPGTGTQSTEATSPPMSPTATAVKAHFPTPTRVVSRPPLPLSKPGSFAVTYPLRILVAEDQPLNRKLLVKMLAKLGYDPHTQIFEAYDGADALRQVVEAQRLSRKREYVDLPSGEAEGHRVKSDGPIDVVLMDLWMPIMDGYEAAERIRSLYGGPTRPPSRRSISEPTGVPSRDATQMFDGYGGSSGGSGGGGGGSVSGSTPAGQTAAAVAVAAAASGLCCDLAAAPPIILAVTADATDGVAERAARAGMQGFMTKPFKLVDLERLVLEGFERRMKALHHVEAHGVHRGSVDVAVSAV